MGNRIISMALSDEQYDIIVQICHASTSTSDGVIAAIFNRGLRAWSEEMIRLLQPTSTDIGKLSSRPVEREGAIGLKHAGGLVVGDPRD